MNSVIILARTVQKRADGGSVQVGLFPLVQPKERQPLLAGKQIHFVNKLAFLSKEPPTVSTLAKVVSTETPKLRNRFETPTPT